MAALGIGSLNTSVDLGITDETESRASTITPALPPTPPRAGRPPSFLPANVVTVYRIWPVGSKPSEE
ncbi:hypothetical protein [Arthrobacter sp. efr-133-TYG-118]|uniref:hypothetical protein n=1 Tax=Arthrobacter sp. efr-133-TYG-118 TaxID=3040279 RepID=UPI00254A018E|nr:hypothetical protein [Arthrobacter sp. efr-133-TYG-118]